MKSNSLSYSSPGRRSLQFSNDHDPNTQLSRAHRRSMSPNYMSPTVSTLGIEFSEDYFFGCSVCGTKAIETSIEGSFHESPPKIRPSNKFDTAENCTENSNSYSKLVKVVKRNSIGDKNEVAEIKKKIIETNSKPEEWDSDVDRSFKIIEEDPANEDGVVINEIHYKEVYPAPKTELTALNYKEAKSVQESFYYNPAAIENVKEEERKRVVIRRAEYSNRTKGVCKSMVATISNADDIKNDNIKEKINKERQKLEELNRERQRLEELQEKKSDLITPKKLKSSSYSVERSTGGRKENDNYIAVRENARKTTPSRADLAKKNGASTPRNEIRTPRSQAAQRSEQDEVKTDPFEYKRNEKPGAEITTPRSQTTSKNEQQQDETRSQASKRLDESKGQILDDSKSDIKTPRSQISIKEDAKNDSFTLQRGGEKTKSIKQSIIEQMSNKDKKSNKDLSFSSKKSVCSAQEYQHTKSDIGEDDLSSLKSMPISQAIEEIYEMKNPEIVVDSTINIFKDEENIQKSTSSQEKVGKDSPKFPVEDIKGGENEKSQIEYSVEEEIVEIEQPQAIVKKPEKVKVRGGKSTGLPGRSYEPVLGNRRSPESPENSEGVIRVKGNLIGSSKADSELSREESKIIENSPYGNTLSIITSPIKDDSIVCEDQIILTEQSPTKIESSENPSEMTTDSPTKILLQSSKSKQEASPAKSSGSKHSSPAKSQDSSSKNSTPLGNSPNSSPSAKLSPLSQSPMPEDIEEPIRDESFDNKSQTSVKSQYSSKSKNDDKKSQTSSKSKNEDSKSQTSSKSKNEDSKSQVSSQSKNEESKSPKMYANQSPISRKSENSENKHEISEGSNEILIEEHSEPELQQRGTGEFPENEQAYPFKDALSENYSQETQEMLHFKPHNIDQRQYRQPSFGENQEDFVDASSINVERASSPALSLESGGKKSKIHYNTFDSIREEHVQYENEYESSLDEYSGQNPNEKSTQTRNSSGGNIEITEVRIHQMLALLCDDKILKGLRMIGGFAQYFEEHGHEFLNR
ncbi:unnamed protein product [Blepharisma stoltei]|uniref:Uncharacterized protein n=1 Tax=Blepharisma stoltei TaxID=1481888 RepID=A0AAU9IWT3_9CILI|nr:unnamed protein product [Blepharisma stoltei]